MTGRSLFDLPLGDHPIYTISEEPVETTIASGCEERFVSVLPAWSANTNLDLDDKQLGFPAAARTVAAALDLADFAYTAAQSVVAHYSAVGFDAAAVTALTVGFSAPRHRLGPRRSATVRFAHPHAVVAATTAADRRGLDAPAGKAWHALPVFSAWITDPTDVEANPHN